MYPITEEYLAILKKFKKIGYEARSFHNFSKLKSHLLLRHDVDVSIERAYEIAKIENNFGWSSVFFILLSSPFYNTLDPLNVKRLREMVEMGHEIAVHLEIEANVDLQQKAKHEALILQNITGQKVKLISFHRPTANAAEFNFKDYRFDGFSHTYENRFINDIGYVSDSRGEWHYGHPLDHHSVKSGFALQFLTHPIWWTCPEAEVAPKNKLQVLRRGLDAKILQEMKFNFNVGWDF